MVIGDVVQAPVLRSGALPRAAKVDIGLLAFLAIAAGPAGWALASAGPGEAPLGMAMEWLRNSPFTSYFIPGLILFGLFGVGSAVAVLLGLARHWLAPYAAFTIGVGQMIWIAVETIMVPLNHPLQPTMFAVGASIASLAFFWWRGTRRQA